MRKSSSGEITMNLEIKKNNRIALSDLITLLKGERSELAQHLVLASSSDHWATDFDLYKASLVLDGELTHTMLAKTLETVTIIPAQAAGETKRPISNEELEELRKVSQ